MKELVICVCGGIAAAFTFIGVLLFFCNMWESTACDTYSKITGLEKNYTFSTECLLKQDGRWVSSKVVLNNMHEITVRKEK